MKRFSRIYLEITNVCNLSCSFCAKNQRTPHFLSVPEFHQLATQVAQLTDHVYFHVLGEPLCHPELATFLDIAHQLGLQVNITTNGTLLANRGHLLRTAPALRKVSISLHSLEADRQSEQHTYLKNVAEFAQKAPDAGKFCELRFWNLGSDDTDNQGLFSQLCTHLDIDATTQAQAKQSLVSQGKYTLKKGLYLGMEDRFRWPSMADPLTHKPAFCYGTRSHIAILCDGTVVPCCLDSNGAVPLGNCFTQPLQEIADSPRVQAIYDGFSNRQAVESLCQRCSYANRFA